MVWMARTALGGLLALMLALSVTHGAEAKSARYRQFNADLTLLADGRFHVRETQTVDFSGGPFVNGHRTLPTARTDGITNVTVAMVEDGEPISFTESSLEELANGGKRYAVVQMPGTVAIYWTFPAITNGSATFLLEYDMLAALRGYPNQSPANQQVWWTAVGSELTGETSVDSARVTVTLPRPVAANTVVADPLQGIDASSLTSDGQTFTWTHGAFDSGDDFTVRLQFPVLLPAYAAPDWQAADDAQREREAKRESRDAFVHLMMIAAGLLAIGGGSSGLYGLWYLRGRDPHVGLVAEFLPQPPDDLSPGAAGALVDEVANESDVIATLLDLVRRGVVIMSETDRGYSFELKQPELATAAHERRMLDAMFGRDPKIGATTTLGTFGPRVRAAYDAYKQDLYDELIKKGYFPESPEKTRQRWIKAGWVTMLSALVVLIIGWIAFDASAFVPAIGVFIIGLVLRRLGRAMPRKTEAGAEAAAKWRAFKRYLTDIEKYEQIKETKRIFADFLPYTIAFGIDTNWVRAFARTDVAPSVWQGAGDVFLPTDVGNWGRPHRGTMYWGSGSGGSSGGSGGGGVTLPDLDMPNIPSLQKMSNRASSGVQSGSSGMMDLLKVAGAIIEIASAFSGGGGKGGSSGGGGGGFS